MKPSHSVGKLRWSITGPVLRRMMSVWAGLKRVAFSIGLALVFLATTQIADAAHTDATRAHTCFISSIPTQLIRVSSGGCLDISSWEIVDNTYHDYDNQPNYKIDKSSPGIVFLLAGIWDILVILIQIILWIVCFIAQVIFSLF